MSEAKECYNNCKECGSNCSERREPQSLIEQTNTDSNIKKVIGIVSGKGGVGKSLVTSLLAASMRKKGYKTAVLDADITGPSIPKMFGLSGKAQTDEEEILPVESANGTKIMSVNLLLDDETDPVIWRGPLIAGTVKQFWTDVCWGNVDYMFVDMPPGTGDVPLTVFQSLPIDGIIVVTSPQDLVSMIVGKAVKMAEMMHIPVIGIVENMAYYECPTCRDKHYIFGKNDIELLAEEYHIGITAEIPIDPSLAKVCDEGRIEDYETDCLENLIEKF